MKAFRSRELRNNNLFHLIDIQVGSKGTLTLVAVHDITTLYRKIPLFVGPTGSPVDSMPPDTSKLVPILPGDECEQGGGEVGSISWIVWTGAISLSPSIQSVVADLSSCITGDIIDLVIGVEE